MKESANEAASEKIRRAMDASMVKKPRLRIGAEVGMGFGADETTLNSLI